MFDRASPLNSFCFRRTLVITFFSLSDLCLFLGVLSDILSYLIRFDSGATWWFSFQYQWIIGLWTVFHIQQHFGLGCLPLLFSNHHDTDVLLWLVGLWSFISSYYRVSHSKVYKVNWLWWGCTFDLFLVWKVLCVPEKPYILPI